jgi:hypothetical protein
MPQESANLTALAELKEQQLNQSVLDITLKEQQLNQSVLDITLKEQQLDVALEGVRAKEGQLLLQAKALDAQLLQVTVTPREPCTILQIVYSL